MAANKILRFGPVALATAMNTNIINPALGSLSGPDGFTMTQPYIVIKHLRIVNTTTSETYFSLWLGASGTNAAGTEVIGSNVTVGGYSYFDYYGVLRLDAGDFLVGGGGATGWRRAGWGEAAEAD